MNADKISKWIKIIAAWSLFLSINDAALNFLIYFKIIEDNFTSHDHIESVINTIAGLLIFVGLWRVTSCGWKFTIIFTFLSWIYSAFDISIDYKQLTGIVATPFIIIDALIIRFLFKSDVMHFFNITSSYLIRFDWIPTALVLLAAFLVTRDLFDGIVAVVTVIGLFIGTRISKKTKKRLTNTKDETTDATSDRE